MQFKMFLSMSFTNWNIILEEYFRMNWLCGPLTKMTFCDYFDGFRLKLVFQGKAYLPISFIFLFRLLPASSIYFRLLIWVAKTFSAKIFKVGKLLKHLELWKLSFMSCLRYAEVIFTTYDESYWKKRTFFDEIF